MGGGAGEGPGRADPGRAVKAEARNTNSKKKGV